VIKERLGSLDAGTLASADLEPVFIEKPAIHRYPAVMAKRIHNLAVHIVEEYDAKPSACDRSGRLTRAAGKHRGAAGLR